ncbi:hypothetical protein RUMTOR_02293 [[Ruminococcus] torques ATCC 27756]|uniref:Uncharacterized protein n=1 Tax=[Ruminococcus] torques ATCC 27756 TaxID=411460 RepID=A5KPV9_9FIRM|nr:hypothetical protein RUMTOR_02293 [[Ruminococcus] torques ATCC 27756]
MKNKLNTEKVSAYRGALRLVFSMIIVCIAEENVCAPPDFCNKMYKIDK